MSNPGNLSPAQIKRMQEKESALQAKKQKQLIILLVVAMLVVWFQFFRGSGEEAPPPPPATVVAAGPDQTVTAPGGSDQAPVTDPELKDPSLLTVTEKRKLQATPSRWPGLQNVPSSARNPYVIQEAP